jgi:hypothetical protein
VFRWFQCLGWIRIRIRGSMPPETNGSGSGIRILIFSSLTFKDASKKLIFNTIFSAYYFSKVHSHHFSKIKSQKESQNNRNQGFSYCFCMMIEGSGSMPLTSGFGSGSGTLGIMCAGFSQCPRGGARHQGAHEEPSGAQSCQGQQHHQDGLRQGRRHRRY